VQFDTLAYGPCLLQSVVNTAPVSKPPLGGLYPWVKIDGDPRVLTEPQYFLLNILKQIWNCQKQANALFNKENPLP